MNNKEENFILDRLSDSGCLYLKANKSNLDNHANQKNPNSEAHKKARDNRANQKNPNNKEYKR